MNPLVKTLDFQLNIQSDNESLLYDATLEARRVSNETIQLAKEGVDWNSISPRLEDDADLVKNTTQRIVAKALGAMENYYEYDDYGLPSHTKDSTYPLRANFTEGYNLSLTETVRPWTGRPVVGPEQIDGRHPRLSKLILAQNIVLRVLVVN